MIVDTGILYALADRSDRHHRVARDIFKRREPRIVPEPVVVETDWMILEYLGLEAELRFVASIASGDVAVENPTSSDRRRAAQIAAQYRDLQLGYVDSVVMAMAERLKETVIATVDFRHFAAVRPAHAEAFTLLPAPLR